MEISTALSTAGKEQIDAPTLCNLCGKSLNEVDLNFDFGLDFEVGYGSKYDLDRFSARFCCRCFDKMVEHLIRRCKINPIIGGESFR